MPSATWDWESRIGKRVRLRDLHVLSAVVHWGSMAKAASHLGMSQSSVSEAISGLEDALRVRLLDRSAQGVEATIYAKALLRRGHTVFDELRQGIKDIEFLAEPTQGEVRIACPELLSAGLLPAAIDQLSRRYPKIIVRVAQADTTTLEFRELQERRVDLMLARVEESFADDALDVEILLKDPHFVVAGESSPWAKRRKVSLAQLVDEPWIFPPNHVVMALITEAFASEGLQVPPESVSASSILLRNHLLATGRFLTLLPDSVLRYNAKQWSLKILPINLPIRPWPIAILTLKNRTLGPVVHVFIEHLRAAAKAISGPRKNLRTASDDAAER
jgi:DNA-binding transcriptional LysR family regulator